MYNNIAHCNVILDQIDLDEDLFTGDNYARIKAEALALRAFMHFELLRLFAPAYDGNNTNMPAIPYVDKLINVRIPFMSIAAVYQRIEDDLLQARTLLKPIDMMGPNSTTSGFTALDSRKVMMNYWACTFLLARLNLYQGRYSEVLQYVDELTTEQSELQVFWADLTRFSTFYPNEWVFQLHLLMVQMREKHATFFERSTAHVNDMLTISLPRVFEIYEIDAGGAGDVRYLDWMSRAESNEVNKYYQMAGFPLMNMSELYLMAAEAAIYVDQGLALSYLNDFREARNLGPLDENVDLFNALLAESLKEYVGEGKLFHFYKRHAFEFIPGYSLSLSASDYVFPIPEKELEFNPMN
jgi:starch-binding outer membrane protein, SusD/RagB family